MKILKTLILTGVLGTIQVFSQETPPLPPIPQVVVKEEYSRTEKSTTSVSDSDDIYKFKSHFDSSKRGKIHKILKEKLDKYTLKEKGKRVFTCTLNDNTVTIFLLKNKVSNRFYKKIKSLSEELRTVIHNNTLYYSFDNDNSSVNAAQRAIEKAQLRLQRAIEKLRESEQNQYKKNNN